MNKGKLDIDKQMQLEMIGVVWDFLNQQWENYFNLCVKYQNREGRCNVPAKYEEDGKKFGMWLSTQRGLMNKERLDPEKQKLLEDVVVVWDVLSYQWENKIKFLVNYKSREGDCNVPVSHKEDGENLGHWLAKQRVLMMKGKLDTVKQIRLEDIGVV